MRESERRRTEMQSIQSMQSEGNQRPTGPGWRMPWPMWGSLRSSAAPPVPRCMGPSNRARTCEVALLWSSSNYKLSLLPVPQGPPTVSTGQRVQPALPLHTLPSTPTPSRAPLPYPKYLVDKFLSLLCSFLLERSSSLLPLHASPSPLPTSQILHQGTVSHPIT